MKNKLKLFLPSLMMVALPLSAMAQTAPDPVDYSDTITAFQTSLSEFFTSNGPLLLVALGVPLIFGIVWKLIKRAAKSV